MVLKILRMTPKRIQKIDTISGSNLHNKRAKFSGCFNKKQGMVSIVNEDRIIRFVLFGQVLAPISCFVMYLFFKYANKDKLPINAVERKKLSKIFLWLTLITFVALLIGFPYLFKEL